MDTVKDLVKTVKGRHTWDGAGVSLIRVIGHDDVCEADPFLMLDAFDSTNPEDYINGFPFHPHRGIETVTYLVEGEIDHKDSLGNSGTILGGQAQWMTAGSGIMHEEMPQRRPRLFGLQLWVNLPAKDKMTDPRYFDITAGMTPVVDIPGGHVRVVAGAYGDVKGVAPAFVQATMLDVTLEPGAVFDMPAENQATVLIYTLEGAGYFGPGGAHEIGCRTGAIFGTGGTFHAQAGDEGVRFMLFAGTPLNEPVAWGGPIAMNTEEELQTAFAELRAGTFVKKSGTGAQHGHL